jgi:predicted nucleotidyltransferase
MDDALRRVLDLEPDLLYALVFGSSARGAHRPDSDVDIAVEFRPGAAQDVRAMGRLAARLESATRCPVDLVLLDEAPAPLAYRVFGHGRLLIERDHAALVARKARVIVEYLDWKPVEERCARGVLRAAAAGGR